MVELLLALYVADFVTGLIHCLLDFQTVDDDELRLSLEAPGATERVWALVGAL